VKFELLNLGLHPLSIELGLVELQEENIEKHRVALNHVLNNLGFEILDTKQSILIEKTKALIIDLVHQKHNHIDTNLSDYLSKELLYDYNSLSSIFTQIQGTTIEKYFILQKIEKIKELIFYDEMTMTQIAYELNYSSVSNMSNQFKKVTGLSPTIYKNLKNKKRTQLDKL
jgi:AraC-like DNA-binding protein